MACRYDQQWYVGAITQRSEIYKDVYVKFMARNKQSLSWPQDLKNECWNPFQVIICLVAASQLQGHSGRQYKLTAQEYQQIVALHNS